MVSASGFSIKNKVQIECKPSLTVSAILRRILFSYPSVLLRPDLMYASNIFSLTLYC